MKKGHIGNKSGDYYERVVEKFSNKLPGPLSKIAATEASVLHYLTLSKNKEQTTVGTFTYHKKSTAKLGLSAFLFILIAETIVIHYLAHEKYPILAYILTFFSLYALMQVTAILRSMKQRMITMEESRQMLTLRYGFASQTGIAYKDIKSIIKSGRSRDTLKGHICLSPWEMIDTTNIFMELHVEHTLTKTYGITKKYTSISFFVDDPDIFITEIQKVISTNEQPDNL